MSTPVCFDYIAHLVVNNLTCVTIKPADPNRETIDPDKLILGLTGYLAVIREEADGEAEENDFGPVFDFFARYVRKIHSDRHIKNTLSSNPGMSFLDMIGPSDVAYVITVLKNSKATWLHNPADTTTAMPKPLFTRGESRKRVFGISTMSDEGHAFFREGVKNWKKVFQHDSSDYEILKTEWANWLRDEGGSVNNDGWRRKNIHSLLATRVLARQRGNRDDHEDEDDEEDSGSDGPTIVECEYDSDGDLGQVGRKRRGREDDDESISMGGGNDNVARGGGAAVDGVIEDDDEDEDDDEEDKEDDGEEDEDEEMNKKPAAKKVVEKRKRPTEDDEDEDEDDDEEDDDEDEGMNKKPAAKKVVAKRKQTTQKQPAVHNTRNHGNKKQKGETGRGKGRRG